MTTFNQLSQVKKTSSSDSPPEHIASLYTDDMTSGMSYSDKTNSESLDGKLEHERIMRKSSLYV